MLLILIFSTLACLLGLVIITWLHNQHWMAIIVEPIRKPSHPCPSISVIVPARNEERNIRNCAEALLAQTYPDFELIVLDDRSSDATLAILRKVAIQDDKQRMRILSGSELPMGWAGKPHALVQATAKARGEWYCFVDADTFVTPEALASVMAKAQETKADLFTILTEQKMVTFWERAVLPLVMTALSVGFSPRKVNNPKRKDAIANGQFILIKRTIYTAVGGHAAIKDSIVEDKDLAILVKEAGYRLVLADGRKVAQTRMYTSLPEMWEGWTKNIFLGLKGSAGMLLLGASGAFLSLMAALALPFWGIAGLTWWSAGGGLAALLLTAEAGLVWVYLLHRRALALRGMNLPIWYALTTPLGAGIFAAMMFASAWKVISGKGVTWKGRRYSANGEV